MYAKTQERVQRLYLSRPQNNVQNIGQNLKAN